MMKYLKPLGVFVGGQLLLLIVLLFFPALGTVGTELEAETTEMVGVFWGWGWVVGAFKLIVFVLYELFIMYATARAFLATRDT